MKIRNLSILTMSSVIVNGLFFNQTIGTKALFVNSPAVVKELTLDKMSLSNYSPNSKILSYNTTFEAAPYGYVDMKLVMSYYGTLHVGNSDYLLMRYDSLATYHPGVTIENNSEYNQKYYNCVTSQAIYNPNNVSPRTTVLDYWPRKSGAEDPVSRLYLSDNGVNYQVCSEVVWPGLTSIFGNNKYVTPDSMLKINKSGTLTDNFYSIQTTNYIEDPKTYTVTAFNDYPGCHAKFDDFTSDKNPGVDKKKTNQEVFTFYFGSLFATKKQNGRYSDIINWYSNYEVGSKNVFGYIHFKTQLEFQVHTSFILE